jgi:hypothetical protein
MSAAVDAVSTATIARAFKLSRRRVAKAQRAGKRRHARATHLQTKGRTLAKEARPIERLEKGTADNEESTGG